MISVQKILTRIKIVQERTFGDWLRETREKRGFGVRQLAGLTNGAVSASYISYLEKNVYKGKKGNPTRPDPEKVDALAKVLGVTIGEARLAAGLAPPPNTPEYESEIQQLMAGLAETIAAKGLDELDPHAREDFFSDLRAIAESMLLRELEKQKKRRIKEFGQ